MSKFAWLCLLLTALSVIGTYLAPAYPPAVGSASKAGLGIFGMLFVVAMLIGRRIKFDPVLR